ncbi:SMP-30/gluconolactonase/LRE family protein [Brevundimonas bacteroides]|uniref:SMP-30/gluconolactonase/LRE family protein n=1 Tax=Brevundimonas bacteroides TaxID=74311 RepID=UPI000B26FE23|nr:SMP-30/gluconolactonase/LRE family protein [Brevundimonas bacteroides]
MTRLTLRATSDVVAAFGESAVWDGRRNGFWWLDMASPQLFFSDATTGRTRTWALSEQAFAVAADGERLILAERAALVRYDPDGGTRQVVATVPLPPDVRLNDGRLMPDGSFVVGSLDLQGGSRSRKASLFRLERDGVVQCLARGFSAINGIAWSDRLGLVFADTRRGRLYQLRARPIACGPAVWPAGFRPDGAAVDAEGRYWSAQYGRGEVWRWTPGTDRVDRFPVEASSITSCAISTGSILAVTTGGAESSDQGRLLLLDMML